MPNFRLTRLAKIRVYAGLTTAFIASGNLALLADGPTCEESRDAAVIGCKAIEIPTCDAEHDRLDDLAEDVEACDRNPERSDRDCEAIYEQWDEASTAQLECIDRRMMAIVDYSECIQSANAEYEICVEERDQPSETDLPETPETPVIDEDTSLYEPTYEGEWGPSGPETSPYII